MQPGRKTFRVASSLTRSLVASEGSVDRTRGRGPRRRKLGHFRAGVFVWTGAGRRRTKRASSGGAALLVEIRGGRPDSLATVPAAVHWVRDSLGRSGEKGATALVVEGLYLGDGRGA